MATKSVQYIACAMTPIQENRSARKRRFRVDGAAAMSLNTLMGSVGSCDAV